MKRYQAISVCRRDGVRLKAKVFACNGVWAVTSSIEPFDRDEMYAVTHIPTGLAAILSLSLRNAKKAMAAFAAVPGDWTFTDRTKMSKRQRRAGNIIGRRYRNA